MVEPRRAQNYIPISGRGRRSSDPARYKTDGNLAVEIERRVQKQPANRETNAQIIAPRAKSKLYNSRIETTTGRKMPLKTAAMQQKGSVAMQQRGSAAMQQRGAAEQQRKTPVQQRSMAERKPEPRTNAAAGRQARQPRQDAYSMQKNTAQAYRSIMQGGHVSMRGEMAIPLPQTGIKIKPERAKAPSAGVAAANRPAGLVSTILLIVFVFGVLSFLLVRSASISSIGLENDKIQKNITSLSQSLDNTKLDVTMQDDLNTIRQKAQQLNMGIPGSGQITYLPEKDAETAQTPSASDTQTADSSKDTFSLNSLFKEIKSWFG